MTKNISKVKEIDVATVEGNKTLATAVDRRAVERCKDAINKLGVLHTPVVGATNSGKRLILSGQCELTALRELGVKKMDAIEVEVAGDEGVKAKLSLLLISLWEKPGALCEGQLLQEAVSAGIPRSEIQIMLGKSASWVCNRLALITRLNHNVYEMVRNGLLEPRSAQEVARLPAQAQFAFAEIAVREGLPKSAIESLIAGYNDESCPDTVKTQILNDPRAALKRMTDKRRAINVDKPDKDKESMPADIIDEYIRSIRMQVSTLRRVFFNEAVFDTMENRVALKGLEAEVKALLMIVRKLISPGKKEVEQNAG